MGLRRSAGPLIAELRRRRRQSLRDRGRIAAAIAFERYVKLVDRQQNGFVYCEPPSHDELVRRFGESFAKAVKGLLGPRPAYNIPDYVHTIGGAVGRVAVTFSIDESGDKKDGETP
jgi:hypothetical protein